MNDPFDELTPKQWRTLEKIQAARACDDEPEAEIQRDDEPVVEFVGDGAPTSPDPTGMDHLTSRAERLQAQARGAANPEGEVIEGVVEEVNEPATQAGDNTRVGPPTDQPVHDLPGGFGDDAGRKSWGRYKQLRDSSDKKHFVCVRCGSIGSRRGHRPLFDAEGVAWYECPSENACEPPEDTEWPQGCTCIGVSDIGYSIFDASMLSSSDYLGPEGEPEVVAGGDDDPADDPADDETGESIEGFMARRGRSQFSPDLGVRLPPDRGR